MICLPPAIMEKIEKVDLGKYEFMSSKESKTLAELMQDPDIFNGALKASESTNNKWGAALLLFHTLGCVSEEQRKESKAVLVNIMMQLATQISCKGFRSIERIRTSYRPGLDEIDVEETLENCMNLGKLGYYDLVMVDKRQKKRAVVLIIDVSNSMQMYKILIAVLAVGVLALHLRGEHYAILAFNKDVKIIKEMEEEQPIEALLEKMLDLKPEGATDIRKGLEKGSEQLMKNMAQEKIAIIATDGWATMGGDPIHIAGKMERLHVIQVPIGRGGGDDRTCIRMAEAGRGRRIFVEQFEELPKAIMEILG
jgi:uncharacterized protein with von Willebrand factor type A (vWA) domain